MTLSSWCHSFGNESNIFYVFLTFYPSSYSAKLFPLLGLFRSFSHICIILSNQFFREKNPHTEIKRICQRCIKLHLYFFGFPWNDFCFRVRYHWECAERMTKVISSSMKERIGYSFFKIKLAKLCLTLSVFASFPQEFYILGIASVLKLLSRGREKIYSEKRWKKLLFIKKQQRFFLSSI